jgi:(2Fe-2S) ferredoxin
MTMSCSDAARARGDALVGTAPPARRWLLIEQHQGWGRVALDSLDAPGVDRAALARALDDTGARLQLIRQPAVRGAARAGASARRWAVVSTDPHPGQRWGTLADGWDAIRDALTPTASPSPRDDTPVLLVCTNGRHDACCAVRGRPVAAALAEAYPGRVWETTHTGGDRFAANLVVLPDGACYGALDPDTAVGVVAAHLRGEPARAHLRGITGRSPQDQATLLAVAGRLGVVPWDRVRLQVRPQPGAAGRATGWRREVLLDGVPVLLVHGHHAIQPAEFLTCAARAPSRATVPMVDDVQGYPTPLGD